MGTHESSRRTGFCDEWDGIGEAMKDAACIIVIGLLAAWLADAVLLMLLFWYAVPGK
jgi:hypothetical protein